MKPIGISTSSLTESVVASLRHPHDGAEVAIFGAGDRRTLAEPIRTRRSIAVDTAPQILKGCVGVLEIPSDISDIEPGPS